jgi:hypothetical protein
MHPAGYPEAGRGTLILVLGILGLVAFGFLTGIPAWVMGQRDLKKIAAGTISPDEKATTQIGMILGIVATAISGFVLLIVLIGLAIALGLVFSHNTGEWSGALLPVLASAARLSADRA